MNTMRLPIFIIFQQTFNGGLHRVLQHWFMGWMPGASVRSKLNDQDEVRSGNVKHETKQSWVCTGRLWTLKENHADYMAHCTDLLSKTTWSHCKDSMRTNSWPDLDTAHLNVSIKAAWSTRFYYTSLCVQDDTQPSTQSNEKNIIFMHLLR